MLGELAKRLVNLVVVVLAAITFFLVPLGGKTLWQHSCAIFTTRPAEELGQALEDTGKQVVDQVRSPRAAASASSLAAAPAPSASTKHR